MSEKRKKISSTSKPIVRERGSGVTDEPSAAEMIQKELAKISANKAAAAASAAAKDKVRIMKSKKSKKKSAGPADADADADPDAAPAASSTNAPAIIKPSSDAVAKDKEDKRKSKRAKVKSDKVVTKLSAAAAAKTIKKPKEAAKRTAPAIASAADERANVSKRIKSHGDFSQAYETVKGYSAASKPVAGSDSDVEDITSDEDKNTSKCSAAAATAVTTGAANASITGKESASSDDDRSSESGSEPDKKKVSGTAPPNSDDDKISDSANTSDDEMVPVKPHVKSELLKSSRGKIVYVPSLLQPPAKDEDINCTRKWSEVKKKNPVIIQVLFLLTSKYKKQNRIPQELKGCNVHDLFFMELKRHGCHIMFAPKQSGDKHDSPRKVTAVIITETVQRSPENTYSSHYGLSIRFYCGDIKPIQCLLHRVLSFVYWDNHLCKADKDRVTHLYLRLVKDQSPSLFTLRKTGNEQHVVMRMFGFLDAVDKDDYENYYWKDGNDIFAPNPLTHVESRVVINIQSVYHQLGGEGVVQSPSVVTQVPLANSSFCFTEDVGSNVAKDVKKLMLKALDNKKTYRYIPTRAGATGLFGNSRCCAWISVIKLLWKNDPATAKAMRLLMEKDKSPFEDMKLLRASKGSKDVTLNKFMAQWKYQLQKIQRTNGLELHETLLVRDTVGLFLCLLIDDHGQSTHTVGVHKSEKGIGFIMDPELKKPIQLNSLLDFSKCLGGKRCIGMSVLIKILPPKVNKMN